MIKLVIFNPKDNESLKNKFNHKQKNPNDIFVKSDDKKALSEALAGNKLEVVNFDEKLDKRHLKGDKVIVPSAADVKKKKEAAAKKKADKKAAEKKASDLAKKKAAADKKKKEAAANKKK
jgi:hypothetical protein